MKELQHVAIIMDGNGRWATKKGFPRTLGHKEGVKALEKIVESSVDFGVKYLTVYAFSTENWKRPESEVNAIFALLNEWLEKKLNSLIENSVKLQILGDLTPFEGTLKEKIEDAIEKTKEGKKLTFSIALNYGGRDEILRAARALVKEGKEGKVSESDIDEKLFASKLYTKDIPDPDLLIRTGGELRTSNFLPWQLVYSEFYVTETLWPDFTPFEYKKAIDSFQSRDRRFGGLTNA